MIKITHIVNRMTKSWWRKTKSLINQLKCTSESSRAWNIGDPERSWRRPISGLRDLGGLIGQCGIAQYWQAKQHGRWQEVSFQIDQPWDPRGVDHQIKGRTRRESGVYCVWSGIESQKITIQDAESEWRRRFELPAHPVSLERTLPNTWARNPGRIIGLTENSLSENDYKRKIIYDHRKMIFPLLRCCYLWE